MIRDTIEQLNERISKLEGKRPVEPVFSPLDKPPLELSSFVSKMEDLKNKQVDDEMSKMNKEMSGVISIYKEGIGNNKLELEISNLPKIVEYSIKFVEEFNVIVSNILKIVHKSKDEKSFFKREMCLNLINEIIDVDNKLIHLIVNIIEELVILDFNKNKYDNAIEKEVSKRKHKNNKSRRLKKFFLRV